MDVRLKGVTRQNGSLESTRGVAKFRVDTFVVIWMSVSFIYVSSLRIRNCERRQFSYWHRILIPTLYAIGNREVAAVRTLQEAYLA